MAQTQDHNFVKSAAVLKLKTDTVAAWVINAKHKTNKVRRDFSHYVCDFKYLISFSTKI
jgi:hypothetical protein